ncbi:MAG: acyl-CoA dehydrogenase family protein [Proteobacteria bacterium]|nr:acyl-CoA dehydrogenase family protein [Pseudomonadota bacterium]
MEFGLTREQTMLLDSLRDMGKRERFKELAVDIDTTGQFPHSLMETYGRIGLLGMTLSSEYGGEGLDSLTAILAIEELAKFSPMIAAPVFESNVGPVRVINLFGTKQQKEAIIPGVCKGELSVSVCMTEASAGSDLTSLATNVEEQKDHYLLNGNKVFITGGGIASHYLVYTRFEGIKGYKGIGAVLVEKDTQGFTFGKQERFLGLRGMPSCALYFDNVKIPKENLVIRPGDFGNLMLAFDIERCGNAAMCLGIAAGAIEEARKYAMERNAFNRPLCEFQNIQFSFADMAMKLDAARLLVYRAAAGAGNGLPSIYEASMGKCYANEMVKEVTDTALQILGGYGYSTDYPLERMLRDARAWQVAGGSLQMLKITMASMIFGRRFDQRK